MTGSDESGEDMESGRVNRANDHTVIWAERPLPNNGTDFTGDAILIVEVAKDTDEPDKWENRGYVPGHRLDGIVGVGWGELFPSSAPGGTGVVGKGGFNQGTGVVGFGGGGPGPGFDGGGPGPAFGGIGVQGVGGGQTAPTWDPNVPPGSGVVAQGGRQTDISNGLRLPHGAGIVAMGGGSGKPLPPLLDTGSLGVYAQGAEAEIRSVPSDSGTTTIGPLTPGAGVLGRGGVPIPRRGPLAAGVIGLAGDTPIPNIGETGDTGVYGSGPTGVFGHGPIGTRGQGDAGPGIHGVGMGNESRGGMFEAVRSAQVQLVPFNLGRQLPSPVTVTPQAIPAGREGPLLPRDGRGGDLMAVEDTARHCTLWFCTDGTDGSRPARWAQVLLGPSFDGTA
ncbi:MAG: hypothetical protein IT305_25455 [Chloroflexi bacterium]|nr:hypothetical protein [Chloroflexota bacterium]